jgi:UDP-glucose 4-epimerase
MILITGGLGYIGARLANALINIGFNVRITTSRVSPSIPSELSLCEIVKIDLNDLTSVDHACVGVKTIIHLASLNSSECEKNPNLAELINSVGTLNILNSAKKNGVSSFLYFSTAHVYGLDLEGIIDENSPTFPSNSYSSSHKLAEEFVLKSNVSGKLSTCVYRLTNVIGSPLHQSTNCWMLIANDLCRKISMNQQPEVHANKFTKRDFIPMQDVIDSTCFYLNQEDNTLGGEIINISSNKQRSLFNLCNLLVERASITLNKNITINYKNLTNKSNDKDFFISNDKALSFGLTLKNSLLDEIDLMMMKYENWFKQK